MSEIHLELPLPEHYRGERAFDSEYAVRDIAWLQEAAESHRRRHGLRHFFQDHCKVHLLAIDCQIDFSFPDGALFVGGRSGRGAMEAHKRLAEFIYKNLHIITSITCTLDTHHPFQIFFPAAHIGPEGRPPPPHTVITVEDYRKGQYRPNPAMAAQLRVSEEWLRKQFLHYLLELERAGKHKLYLWPYHCLLGTRGHRLAGIIDEARLFHSFARGAPDRPVTKGSHPLTEHYSVFSPEVTTRWDGGVLEEGLRNEALLNELLRADMVLVAGLASSHCVKESVEDLLREIRKRDPGLARRVYLLEDCTEAVVVPGGPDFTDEAHRAFSAFRQAGINVVSTRKPVSEWPEIPQELF